MRSGAKEQREFCWGVVLALPAIREPEKSAATLAAQKNTYHQVNAVMLIKRNYLQRRGGDKGVGRRNLIGVTGIRRFRHIARKFAGIRCKPASGIYRRMLNGGVRRPI